MRFPHVRPINLFLVFFCLLCLCPGKIKAAWTEPVGAPPSQNVNAPLLKQSTAQDGPINIKEVTTSGAGKLQAREVCICSANDCLATECKSSWASVAGYWNQAGSDIYFNAGNVGIGTAAAPQGKFQVMGNTGFDGAGRVYITNNATSHGRINLVLTGRMDGTNDAWQFGTNARNSLVFNTNLGGAQGALGTEKYSLQLEGNSGALGFLSATKGNTPVMVLAQNGNMGIGTTAPNSMLHVYQTSGNNAEIDLQSVAGSGQQWAIYHDRITEGLRFWNADAPGDKNVLTLAKTGNIGFGLLYPDSGLTIGERNITTDVFNYDNPTSHSLSSLLMQNPLCPCDTTSTIRDCSIAANGSFDTEVNLGLSVGQECFDRAGTSVIGGVTYYNYWVYTLESITPTPRVANPIHVVSGNSIFDGKIGIGASTPSEKLEILTSGRSILSLQGDSSGNWVGTTIKDTSGTEKWFMGSNSNNLLLRRNGSVNDLIINSSGNVGVGISPTTKFEVAGTVKATAFVGDGSGLTNISGALPSGAQGQTLYHNGTSWAASNNIYNNGGNIGIGTASPGEKLQVQGNISVANNTVKAIGRKPKAVLIGAQSSLESNAPTWNWLKNNSHITTTVDFSSTADTLAAADYDIYIADFYCWSVDATAAAKIFALWKQYGKNVITMGNDSTSAVYPITTTSSHSGSYASSVAQPHIITRDYSAVTDIGNATDNGNDITGFRTQFQKLYALTSDSNKIEGIIGESERGGIWFHDQTGYLNTNANSQGVLLSVLAYDNVSDARMIGARIANTGYRNIQDLVYADQAAGNVGIGTTNPSGKLQISGGKEIVDSTSGSWGQVQIGNSSNAETSLTFLPGVTAYGTSPAATYKWNLGAGINSIGTDKFGFGRDGATYMAFNTSGNVGIGTTNPGAKLEIYGNTSITNRGNLNFYSDAGGSNQYINFNTSSGQNYGSLTMTAGTNSVSLSSYNSSNNLGTLDIYGHKKLQLRSGSEVDIQTNNVGPVNINGLNLNFNAGLGGTFKMSGDTINLTSSSGTMPSRLYIDSSGEVGIGTTSPGAKFHVVDTGKKGLKIYPDDDNVALAFDDSGTGTYYNMRLRWHETTINGDLIIGDSGNIGIGTDTPKSKLSIERGGITVDGSLQKGMWQSRVPANNVITSIEQVNDEGASTNNTNTSSVSIGTDGLPVIAYITHRKTAGNDYLKVLKCGTAACDTGNLTNTVGPIKFLADSIISMAIGSDGLPVISYPGDLSGSYVLYVTKCLDPMCSTSDTNIVWQSGDPSATGYRSSITIGTDGFPIIAYDDISLHDLLVAKCNDLSCSSVTFNRPDSAGNVGEYPSIAISSDGLPIISYFDDTNDDLKAIKCGDSSCSSGNTTSVVESTGATGYFTSITIGNDGLPLISYKGASGDLKIAKCTSQTCNTSTIINIDSVGDVGYDTSIAISSDGFPIISYQDGTNLDLKVAKCGPSSCSPGYKIDTTGTVGRYSSIAIGSDGLPVISYYDRTNQRLKVVKCGSESCVPYATRR